EVRVAEVEQRAEANLFILVIDESPEGVSGARHRIGRDERRPKVVQRLGRLVAGGNGVAQQRCGLHEVAVVVRVDPLLSTREPRAAVERGYQNQTRGDRRGFSGRPTLPTTSTLDERCVQKQQHERRE